MNEVFPIAPGAAKSLWFLGAVCALLLGVLAVLLWTTWSIRHSRVEVGPAGVRLVGDLWGRTIPYERLDLTGARVVDLEREPELRPRSRTMGTGLPGYASGWFRLAGGGKALVYLTDRRKVAYIPTRDDYALLLGVGEPERLLEALGRRGGGAR